MSTIAAISTAPGMGGIAVIRVSGPEAIERVSSLFVGKRDLRTVRPSSACYGRIIRGTEELDEAVCTVFRTPHSFTGEDTVEITCHGSTYIQDTLMHWLIDAGVRQAGPGEFTRRAFLNGRMDLTQAEAVADLIAAESQAEKDMALSQLKGGIRTEIHSMREQLLTFTSLLELELDFADHEELEFVDRTQLRQLITQVQERLSSLIASFRTGNAIRQGIPVAIVGPTNAGKSTLLNALVGEERAIVSDIHGTTRDTIEDTLWLGGIRFRLIDTAGLRDTTDTIERLGIERSRQAIERAAIVISLTDCREAEIPMPEYLKGREHVIRVFSKADLLSKDARRSSEGIYISAQQGEIEPLREALLAAADLQPSNTMVNNVRHYEALQRAHEALLRVEQGMDMGLSGELLSLDLQDSLSALGEITGQITTDEVLSTIFSKFCIGK